MANHAKWMIYGANWGISHTAACGAPIRRRGVAPMRTIPRGAADCSQHRKATEAVRQDSHRRLTLTAPRRQPLARRSDLR